MNGFVSVSLLCAVLAFLIVHLYVQFLGQAVHGVYHPGGNFTVNDAISAGNAASDDATIKCLSRDKTLQWARFVIESRASYRREVSPDLRDRFQCKTVCDTYI